MSWAHLSPEAREAARVKGLAKRRANKAAKLAALEAGPEISKPVDLIPVVEPDPTLDLLSDEEIEEIRAQEKKKYDAEKKSLLKKAAAEQIRLELRRSGGDIPQNALPSAAFDIGIVNDRQDRRGVCCLLRSVFALGMASLGAMEYPRFSHDFALGSTGRYRPGGTHRR